MSLKIAFIGGGNMTHAHLEGLTGHDVAELVGVADPKEGVAANVCATFGGRAFTDYRRMFEDLDLDAVFVCVPPFAHAEIEMDAVARGLPLFVEKPVNLDVKRATAIADAIDRAGLVSATGYVLRYFPFYDQLATVLSGMVIRQIMVRRWHKSVPQSVWHRQMELSGGQVLEQLTHQIDTVRALAGEVSSVSASYANSFDSSVDADIPSNSTVLMQLTSGAGVTCLSGFGCSVEYNDMSILTDQALINVDYESGITIESEADIDVPSLKPVDDAWSHALKVGDLEFLHEVQERGSSELRTSYQDGVRSLAVSVASNISAAESRTVKIAELMS